MRSKKPKRQRLGKKKLQALTSNAQYLVRCIINAQRQKNVAILGDFATQLAETLSENPQLARTFPHLKTVAQTATNIIFPENERLRKIGIGMF